MRSVSFPKSAIAVSPEATGASSSSGALSKARTLRPEVAMQDLRLRTQAASSSEPPRPRAVIGVMGGMGPAAANQFGHQLIQLKSDANKDQDHARVLLDQATDIPDRTAAILNNGTNPVKNMEASLKRLDQGGASLVAVTCNTAHHFHDDMQKAIDKFGLKLELLHIVDATMAELERQRPGAKRIGLLATTGTLDSRIYQARAEQTGQNKEWVVPDAHTQAANVMDGIYKGVKAGDNDMGKQLLLAAAEELKSKGVDAILLACTEIPLVLKTGDLKDAHGKDLPLIDTLESLAKEALSRAASAPARVETPVGCFSAAQATLSAFTQGVTNFLAGEAERPRRIGVMGGMGPAAAMQFSDYVVKYNTGAKRDQDHAPVLVDQATDIPDRTRAILGQGPSPVEEMGNSLRRLARAGATDIVMTCNTAHHFEPAMQKIIAGEKLPVNLIHIVDATMKLLDQQAPGARNIGLLATTGTVNSQVYQNRAGGREWMQPSPGTQEKVMDGIYKGVKAGDLKGGGQLLRQAAQELANNGADAILLACTEIPLVLKTGDIKNKDGKVVPLIDTLEAQAREAIQRSREPIPATPGVLQRLASLLSPSHSKAHAHPALAQA
jgi:aspartate racemase